MSEQQQYTDFFLPRLNSMLEERGYVTNVVVPAAVRSHQNEKQTVENDRTLHTPTQTIDSPLSILLSAWYTFQGAARVLICVDLLST